jgi:hypothetical protein
VKRIPAGLNCFICKEYLYLLFRAGSKLYTISMGREEFLSEFKNIYIMLKEHQEWQYRYPEKYEETMRSARSQFIELVNRRIGARFTTVVYPFIPIDRVKGPSLVECRHLLSRTARNIKRAMDRDHELGRHRYDHLYDAWRTAVERFSHN